MSTTTTTYRKLVKATVGSGQTWGGGIIISNNMDTLDAEATGVFNVITWGATGNGSTDDTSAVQSALDAAGTYAASHGGAIVVFPPAKYSIAAGTRLTVKSDVTIWAYGAYIFKAGTPSNGLLANFIVATDTFSSYGGNSRIRLYGGIWDGKAQNAATDAAYDTIDFNHCQDIIVRDVTIRNSCSDHALEFNSTDGGQAINCRFEGFRDATTGSTRQYSEAIQIDVAVSGSASIGSFDGTHSKNILVQGCYMGPAVDGSGLGSFGKLVGGHTTATGQAYKNIRIIGNVVDGALDVGIQAYNWVDSVIANNVVYNTTSHGIQITVPDPTVVSFSVLSSGVVVSGNTIDTTAGSAVGIKVLGYTSTAGITDCAVLDNTIRNAGGNGILAQLTYNQLIAGNTIDTTGSNGINVTASQYPVVSGNWIQKPATNYCVFFGQVTSPSTVSATDGKISDNMCLLGTGATAGIRLSTGTDKCLISNNTVRKAGGSQTIAVSCAGGVGTTNSVVFNDLTGFTDATATITVTNGTINKSLPATTNIGSNLG